MCLHEIIFIFRNILDTIKVIIQNSLVGTFGLNQAKRIIVVEDEQDPYETKTNEMGENIQVENVETISYGRRNQVTPLDIAETMRTLIVEL